MTIIQNTTGMVAFEALNGGAPVDLSGYTIEISLKQDVPELVLSKDGANVVVYGDDNEKCMATFAPTETIQLKPGFAKAQCRVKDGNGTVVGNVAKVVRVAETLSTEAL